MTSKVPSLLGDIEQIVLPAADVVAAVEPSKETGPYFDGYAAAVWHALATRGDVVALPMLLDYLRHHGKELPVLTMVAEWLDPKGNSGWHLKFSRRRGKRLASETKWLQSAEIRHCVDEALRAQPGKRRSKKMAIGDVAEVKGLKDSTVKAAYRRRAK